MTTASDIIKDSMSFNEMAKLITDLAGIYNVEIPSKPTGAEMFTIRMIGAATMAKRHSDVVRGYQSAHHNLMGV